MKITRHPFFPLYVTAALVVAWFAFLGVLSALPADMPCTA